MMGEDEDNLLTLLFHPPPLFSSPFRDQTTWRNHLPLRNRPSLASSDRLIDFWGAKIDKFWIK